MAGGFLLQLFFLADMDITFKALKETNIGRHVNRLRRLVKHLVRKWNDIVDEWVKLNPPAGHETSALMVDGDSPQQKIFQNSHHQVPEFAYSPNPQNKSSGLDKNNLEPERKPKSVTPARRETPTKPPQSVAPHVPQSVQRPREQQRAIEQKESKVVQIQKG